jgi:ubiquinone/menaquinone biosynthesis C-methylase UbiE
MKNESIKKLILYFFFDSLIFNKKFQKRAIDLINKTKILDYIKEGNTYLDIGSGTGHICEQLAKEKKLKLIALEPKSKPSNKILKRLKGNYEKILLIKGLGEQLPFKNQRFDGIFLFFVLHHVPSAIESKIFNEIERVIKPDGLLLIVEDTPENEEERIINEKWDRWINVEPRAEKHYYKNNNQWLELFQKNGYSIIEKNYFEGKRFKGYPIKHSSYILKKNY